MDLRPFRASPRPVLLGNRRGRCLCWSALGAFVLVATVAIAYRQLGVRLWCNNDTSLVASLPSTSALQIPPNFSHVARDEPVVTFPPTSTRQSLPSFTMKPPAGDTRASRVAYAWYLTDFGNAQFACGVLVAASAIRASNPRPNAEFVLIHVGDVPDRRRFERFHIRMIKVSPPATRGRHQWVWSFAKLRISGLFEYSRIIFFDVDTFPLGGLDHLFDLSSFPLELAAPRAYWLHNQPFVQSGGPIVIDPSSLYFERHFSKILDEGITSEFDGEMDWVNMEFRDTAVVLDGFYSVLIGEWCPSDDIYRHWQRHFDKSARWVMEHAPLVHFVADWKPWDVTNAKGLHRKCYRYQPELLEIYQRWWQTRDRVCY